MKSPSNIAQKVQCLWVMGAADRIPLIRKLRRAGIELATAESCGQARQILRQSPELRVVLTDVTLPDGNWLTVFKESLRNGLTAAVLVCAPHHDPRFWNEVVERGCEYVSGDSGLERETLRLIRQCATPLGPQREVSGAGFSQAYA